MFDNEEHSALFLKMFFLRIFFFWIKLYLEIDSSSLFDFIEWLGFGLGRVLLLGFFSNFYALGAICILSVYFVASLGCFLFYNEFGVYLSKKKKRKEKKTSKRQV